MMNHKTIPSGHSSCLKCGFNTALLAAKKLKISCEDLMNINQTHKWVKNPNFEWPNYDERICSTCGIKGKVGIGITVIASLNNLYTCNEYLMLKANE